jgi:hypothetical protein
MPIRGDHAGGPHAGQPVRLAGALLDRARAALV